VHVLDPLVLAEDSEGLYVVLHKQAKLGMRMVIELLFHLVLVNGPGGDVVLYYTPLDEEAMEKSDLESSGSLHERRKTVMSAGYNVVRGKETGCIVLSPDALGLTRAQMVVSAEYEVELEETIALKLLRQIFSPLLAAQQTYERCDWVDERKARYFVSVLIPTVPVPNADELAMVDRALKYNLEDELFQRVRGSLKKHRTISMFVGSGSSAKRVWGKGYGDVDEALEDVFAFVWRSCSYERMAVHRRKHGDLIRITDAEDGKRSQTVLSEQRTAPAMANRWFKTTFTWSRLESGDIAVAFEPATTSGAEILFTPEAVEGKISGLYLFKAISSRVTTLTIVQTVDFGLALPKWFAEALIPTTLTLILRAQEKFRRPDNVVDKEMRGAIAARIESSVVGVLPGDKDAFDSCLKIKKNFELKKISHRKNVLMAPSPFIAYSMCPAQMADGEAGKRRAGTGKATAEVDTSATDAAAWIFDACSRDRMRINAEDNLSLPRVITRKEGSNSFVVGSIKHAPFPLWNREFVIRLSWAKADGDRVYVWA
jgi:hypothetical protein